MHSSLELLTFVTLQERVSNGGLFLALEWPMTNEITAKIKCVHTKHVDVW